MSDIILSKAQLATALQESRENERASSEGWTDAMRVLQATSRERDELRAAADDHSQQIAAHVRVRTDALARAARLQAQLTDTEAQLARTVQTSHDREAALHDALIALARSTP